MQLKQQQTGRRSRDVALVKFIWTYVRPYRGVFFLSVLLMPLNSAFALAQPLPQPKPTDPGGSCPHDWTSSGSFCVPREGAQDAVPLPPNGTCPWGWTHSGSYCLRSGGSGAR